MSAGTASATDAPVAPTVRPPEDLLRRGTSSPQAGSPCAAALGSLELRARVRGVVPARAHRVLVYDRPLGSAGLTWGELVAWWQASGGLADEREAAKALYRRLARSVADSCCYPSDVAS